MAYIDKIHHPYALNNPVTIYDEESLTALELVARLAGKLNETIKAYNELDEETRQRLTEQDKAIMEGLATMTQQLPPYVSDWLEQHPEITTSLQDGEILMEKLHTSLKHQTKNAYVIPEMFGTVGQGDDTAAIQAALNNSEGLPVLLSHDYTLGSSVWVSSNKQLIVDGTLYVNNPAAAIIVEGSGAKITGLGCVQAKNPGMGGNGFYLCSNNAPGIFFNHITVSEIRGFGEGIHLRHLPSDGNKPTFFNYIEGVTFVDCGNAVTLLGWANGNKLDNLTLYNCGVENEPQRGAIYFDGTDDYYPMENMITNISTTNAENRSSIGIGPGCENNYFAGLQFENGGEKAWGIYAARPETFKRNTICGLIDINNMGSVRGVDNTWLMAFDGRNEMPVIKTREQYRPCGFKYALKKDSSQQAFSDGTPYTVARIQLPAYAVANVNLRAMLVSSAAGDIATGATSNLIIRTKSDGSVVPCTDGNFNVSSDGWIHLTTPDAGVGVAHYTTCFVEMDIITTTRDTSQTMTPGHYGVTITPYDTFKEYKGDW